MYTPIKRQCNNAINEMASPRTPETSLSFSRELRQVLQERNLLTVKSRSKGKWCKYKQQMTFKYVYLYLQYVPC